MWWNGQGVCFFFLFPAEKCVMIELKLTYPFFASVSIPSKPESKRMDSEKLAKLLSNQCWTGHIPFLAFLISIHVCKRFAHLIK